MAAHETLGKSDEWYTPKYIFDALNTSFDLDVASPGASAVSWVPAAEHITSDSLQRPWEGFIWMNPPYGGRNGIVPWMRKFIEHGNGVALTPNRAGAPWWQEFAHQVDAVLFVSPKIQFVKPDGLLGKSPGVSSCLFAIGPKGVQALINGARLGWLSAQIKETKE